VPVVCRAALGFVGWGSRMPTNAEGKCLTKRLYRRVKYLVTLSCNKVRLIFSSSGYIPSTPHPPHLHPKTEYLVLFEPKLFVFQSRVRVSVPISYLQVKSERLIWY